MAPVGREFDDDAQAAAHLTYEILWSQAARLRRSRMASDLWLSEVDFGKIENLRIAPWCEIAARPLAQLCLQSIDIR